MIPSFVKTTVRFLTGCFILILLVLTLSHFLVRKYSSFDLPATTKHLVLGHSHPECAFDDSRLVNFQNLAKGGESYLYTYYKLRELLPVNPQIETVWIEFSNSTISPAMDQWTWGFEKLNAFYPRHAPFMDLDDIKFLYGKNPNDFIAVNSTSTRSNLMKIILGKLSIDDDFGSFVANERMMTEDSLPLTTYDRYKQNSSSISETNLWYLDSILNLCKRQEVQVILVRSPQHVIFNRQNEELLNHILVTRYKNVPFLDFDRVIIKTECFGDPGHLNVLGAQKFTDYLTESMDSLNNIIWSKSNTLP